MARRDRLATLRKVRGFSQESLAGRLGVTRITVARWEDGTSTPYPRHRPSLAAALEVSLGDLDSLLAADDEALDQGQHDVDRRAFLTGAGASLATTVAQLERATAAAGTDNQRRIALHLLGHAYQAAGETAFDQLDFRSAVDHLHEAHQIGVEFGDTTMISDAQVLLGDVARRQRRYGPALRLLDTAERHAVAAGAITQARRWQILARAHAELGNRPAFDSAIGRAEDIASAVSPEHHRDGDHSPRQMRLERGQGLTLLGDPTAALTIYEQAAPLAFRTDRERGSFLIIHAQALAHAGDLREGVSVAIDGLELARSYGSPRHVSRVQRMYDRLTRDMETTAPPLADLRDALAA